jgi:Domain of unknown function (DUF4326)
MPAEILIASLRKDAPPLPAGVAPVRVDRKTALANPFVMNDESERDHTCDQFEAWAWNEARQEGKFRRALLGLVEAHRQGKPLGLLCWCHPKRCHAETLRELILRSCEWA